MENHSTHYHQTTESSLEGIVAKIGEALIATTETVERLAERVDILAIQVQHQSHQVQQQGYQILALSDAIETFVKTQESNDVNIQKLIQVLENVKQN
jgi:hypothetical protein